MDDPANRDSHGPTPVAPPAPPVAPPAPPAPRRHREQFVLGCVGFWGFPLVGGVWFFLFLGFQRLLQLQVDSAFLAAVGGALGVLLVACIVIRKLPIVRGLIVGGWATAIQFAAFVAWMDDSTWVGTTASGGDGAMAAAVQLGYIALVYCGCAVFGTWAALLLFAVVRVTEWGLPVNADEKGTSKRSTPG